MGQILHGSATTTEAIRRAIQNSEESLKALSARYGINQKTVAKWRKRTWVADLPTGPKDAKSTVLTLDDEAIIVAFRRHTLLPLDDCLYALQPTMGKTSKMGQRDIRTLLVSGAMAVLQAAERFGTPNNGWLSRLRARKPRMVVAIALANKMACGLWAMMTKQEDYRNPVATMA